MYRTIWCVVLFALGLQGQTAQDVAKLTPAFSKVLLTTGAGNDTVSQAASQALTDAIMALTIKAHPPTREEVSDFANSLRGIAAGKQANPTQASVLTRCVLDIVHSRGLSNFALAAQVRGAVTTLGGSSQKVDIVVQRFIAIGESVRGPDALPAKDADPINPMILTKQK